MPVLGPAVEVAGDVDLAVAPVDELEANRAAVVLRGRRRARSPSRPQDLPVRAGVVARVGAALRVLLAGDEEAALVAPLAAGRRAGPGAGAALGRRRRSGCPGRPSASPHFKQPGSHSTQDWTWPSTVQRVVPTASQPASDTQISLHVPASQVSSSPQGWGPAPVEAAVVVLRAGQEASSPLAQTARSVVSQPSSSRHTQPSVVQVSCTPQPPGRPHCRQPSSTSSQTR